MGTTLVTARVENETLTQIDTISVERRKNRPSAHSSTRSAVVNDLLATAEGWPERLASKE